MTIPRNPVRVSSYRIYGFLVWFWSCRSCDWVSLGDTSSFAVGTHAHRHARECRDAS